MHSASKARCSLSSACQALQHLGARCTGDTRDMDPALWPGVSCKGVQHPAHWVQSRLEMGGLQKQWDILGAGSPLSVPPAAWCHS